MSTAKRNGDRKTIQYPDRHFCCLSLFGFAYILELAKIWSEQRSNFSKSIMNGDRHRYFLMLLYFKIVEGAHFFFSAPPSLMQQKHQAIWGKKTKVKKCSSLYFCEKTWRKKMFFPHPSPTLKSVFPQSPWSNFYSPPPLSNGQNVVPCLGCFLGGAHVSIFVYYHV